MSDDRTFGQWLFPGDVTTKAKEDEEAKIPDNPAKGDEPHMKLGESLAKFGLRPRPKDVDGLGPQVHGSPWISDVKNIDAIFTGLKKMGYLSSLPKASQMNPKKGASFRKPQSGIMVEMGRDDKNVYLYITDDNEKKK